VQKAPKKFGNHFSTYLELTQAAKINCVPRIKSPDVPGDVSKSAYSMGQNLFPKILAFSRFKSEITSFLIWTLIKYGYTLGGNPLLYLLAQGAQTRGVRGGGDRLSGVR
jgi:hypothetical protein